MNGRRQAQAGFTLIEVMVGLTISSVVAITLAGAFLIGYRTIATEARQIAADQAVSQASLPLTRDLSSATTISTGTLAPSSGTLTVMYGSPSVSAIYQIDANKNLTRSVAGATSVAGRGMQSLSIAAGAPACEYTITMLPSPVGASAVTLRVSRRVGSGGCL